MQQLFSFSDRVRSDCGKCNGTGRVWALHVDNGRCWSCDGVGYHMIKRKSAKAKARRAEKKAAEKARLEAQIAENNRIYEANVDRLLNDPRVGPDTRETMRKYRSRSGSACYEWVQLLLEWEKDPASFEAKYPHVVRNAAR